MTNFEMSNNDKSRFYKKNFWRGQYRARNLHRGRGSRRGRTNQTSNDSSLDNSGPSDLSLTVTSNDAFSPPVQRTPSSVPYNHTKIMCSPYAGWKLYFPEEDYKNSHEIVRKVKAVEEFVINHRNLFNEEEVEERRSFVFDLKVCFASNEFEDKWPSFKDDLYNNPTDTLNCLGLAVHQVVWKSMKEQSLPLQDTDVTSIDVPLIKARVNNYNVKTQLKNLKTNYYGKLVSISGTVIRVGNAKLLCSWMAFQCNGCTTIQCVKQPDGAFTQPTKCLNSECRCRTFLAMRSSPYTQTFDWQSVKIQELVPDDQREGGRVPRTVECELSDDLVATCTPGDIVTISGIVKVRSTEENLRKSKGPSMFTLYIDAVSVTNNKDMDYLGNANKDTGLSVQFTQRDYDAIQEIHSEPNLFKLLVNSLCPTIYGHEMVKAGLLLALFGGSQTDLMESRGQIHVLVVGDPGLGKSQMLQACSFVAPRGVFVCGNTTTSSGLTVTLAREGSGDYSLEAGALVLADQGCCCIDEFDKMSTQHQALLEVMEQQTVSIAKAGVICMLPARTTVLAAANPAGGHYNKGKTVSENLRMGQALLSRFDLVFILLDKPNEHLDSMLSEHVMKIHSGLVSDLNSTLVDVGSQNSGAIRDIALCDRLKVLYNEKLDLIPPQLLRKYIAYSRKYVQAPVLSQDARVALQQFYSKIRENHHSLDSTPVTTRQLLSLVRLTQARAKLELREEVTLTDALEVIELIKWSMIDTYSDEHGTLDFQRSQHGSGMSSRNQAKRFLTIMHRKAESLSRSTFSISEMKEIATSAKIEVENFSSFISTLNTQGFLLHKGKQIYQILSAD